MMSDQSPNFFKSNKNSATAVKTISLLICTFNRSGILAQCLDSVLKMNDPGCSFEVIVIDNNSTDNTFLKVKEFISENSQLDIRLFKEEKQGLSFSRNLAIQEAEGELLVFLDDDAIVDADYLLSYRRYYKENQYSCMGSKILPWFKDESLKIPSWFNKTNWGVLSMLDMGEHVKKVIYPQFPYGGNLAVSKALFQEFGFFDESMGRKGKSLNSNMEIEFMNRLQKSQIPIYYVPDAIIYHLVQPERMNPKFFFKRFYAQGKSDVYLFNQERGISFILKSLHKRIIETICAPIIFIYRKLIKREDYFKPILRLFYNLGLFVETTVSLFIHFKRSN